VVAPREALQSTTRTLLLTVPGRIHSVAGRPATPPPIPNPYAGSTSSPNANLTTMPREESLAAAFLVSLVSCARD
jgi:hypothetical protein